VLVSLWMTNYPRPWRAWSWSCHRFTFLGAQLYLWNDRSYSRQVWYTCRLYQMLTSRWQTTAIGHGQDYVNRF